MIDLILMLIAGLVVVSAVCFVVRIVADVACFALVVGIVLGIAYYLHLIP